MISIKRVQFKTMVQSTWFGDSSIDAERNGAMFEIRYNRDEREFVIIDKRKEAVGRLPLVVPIENVASYEPYLVGEHEPAKRPYVRRAVSE